MQWSEKPKTAQTGDIYSSAVTLAINNINILANHQLMSTFLKLDIAHQIMINVETFALQTFIYYIYTELLL